MHSSRPTYLFVLPWPLEHAGGVNQVVLQLAQEMQRAGLFEPLVLIPDWAAVQPQWGAFQGLRTVRWRVRPYPFGANLKTRLAYLLWRRQFRTAFQRFCQENQIAAINAHYPTPSVFILEQIARGLAKPIPLLLSFHGADLSAVADAPAPEVAAWRALAQRVQANVVCSQDMQRRVHQTLGKNVAACVIHNGIHAHQFERMADVTQTPPTPCGRIVLNVGKFEHKKGQDVLIEAFAQVKDDYSDLELLLVGASDQALPALQALCQQHKLGSRVHFFQDLPHAHMAGFFQKTSIFVLPSRVEPFGLVLLEAGVFGIPVIASRVGGIPEILEDGVTGRLVPPDNPEALAVCLRTLLDEPASAQAMGLRLRQHVASVFTWSQAHAKYVALLPGQYRSTEIAR
jgi:glycosyltransferase involved in cell wall biosynthesis